MAKAPVNLVKKAMTKSVAPKLSNLYTGTALRSAPIVGAMAVGTGVAVGMMGGLGAERYETESNRLAKSANSILGDGSLAAAVRQPAVEAVSPSLMASGQITPPAGNAPDLSASGDLVFGMHNMR